MPRALHDDALRRALEDQAAAGITGRDVTTFLLDRLRRFTDGASVFSNLALLVGNARLAGHLASALAEVADERRVKAHVGREEL